MKTQKRPTTKNEQMRKRERRGPARKMNRKMKQRKENAGRSFAESAYGTHTYEYANPWREEEVFFTNTSGGGWLNHDG